MADLTVVRTFYIYKITCTATGLSYIGLTTRKDQRLGEHRNASQNKKLRAAIELYGSASLVYDIIDQCANAVDARALEKKYITEHKTGWPNGYNIQSAGRGVLASVQTAEMKERRAAAQRRLWDNPEHRKKVSARSKAFWAQPENKAGMIERAIKRWSEPEYIAKQSASHWSKRHSEKTKEKLSRMALERAKKKREAGEQFNVVNLAAGNKRAWDDPQRREIRMAAIAAFWASPEGVAMKQKLASQTAEMNKRRNADPSIAAEIGRKISAAKTGFRFTAESRAKMSESAKRRCAVKKKAK